MSVGRHNNNYLGTLALNISSSVPKFGLLSFLKQIRFMSPYETEC